MQFRVRAFDRFSGQPVDRLVDALSDAEAKRSVSSENLIVLSIAPIRSWSPVVLSDRRVIDLALFCGELRTLLKAGLSLIEATEALASRHSGLVRQVYVHLCSELRQGRSFASALAACPQWFPPILVAAVQSAERTGRLADALSEFGRYHQVVQELRRKVISAAVYPATVLVFGFLVTFFLLVYVVPRFASVYESLGSNASVGSNVLMALSKHMAWAWPLWVGAALIGGGVVVWLWLTGRLPVMLLQSARRLKFLDRFLRMFEFAQAYRSLAMLTQGGFSLLESLRLVGTGGFDTLTLQAFQGVAGRVAEGVHLSRALAAYELTDAVTERLIAAGERSGNLADAFEAIANDYSARLELAVERAMRLAEPLLMMLVGCMVGVLVILMYMPIFDLAGAVSP